MKILLSPQVAEGEIKYTFTNQKVEIEIGETKEVFDFSSLPNGRLELFGEEGEFLIETALDPFPIISAEKKEGTVYLELLNWIPENAREKYRFPEWINAVDYEPPKEPEEDEDGVASKSKAPDDWGDF